MLRLIHPNQLDPALIGLIEESDRTDFSGGEALPEVVSMHAQLWEYRSDEAHGVLITQLREERGEKHLFLWRVIGKGMIKVYAEMQETLTKFARENGATKLRTITAPKLAQYSVQHGAHVLGVILEKEI